MIDSVVNALRGRTGESMSLLQLFPLLLHRFRLFGRTGVKSSTTTVILIPLCHPSRAMIPNPSCLRTSHLQPSLRKNGEVTHPYVVPAMYFAMDHPLLLRLMQELAAVPRTSREPPSLSAPMFTKLHARYRLRSGPFGIWERLVKAAHDCSMEFQKH